MRGIPEPKDSTNSTSRYMRINSLLRGIDIPLKNSSLERDSGKRPADVISNLSGNISNLGGTSKE